MWSMISSFFGGIWGRIAAIGAILLGVLLAILEVFSKGKQAQKAEDQAQQGKELEQAVEIKQEVHNEVQQLPVSEDTPVGIAPTNSAAGKLRDQWSRD